MKHLENILSELFHNIRETGEPPPMGFKEFIQLSVDKPDVVFRDIFQLFHDMIYSYVGGGFDEYPDDPESINFVYYDCSRLFVDGTDHPFFADRLFANRLVNLASSFKRGIQQNRIYIFEGPHGCGKSTFLNNLLLKFEQYTKTEKGASYETVWRLDKKELGMVPENEVQAIVSQLSSLVNQSALTPRSIPKNNILNPVNKDFLEVPCPSHDSPLLLIPKGYRKEMLDNLITDRVFKQRLFSEKQYEWVFRENPCTICMSLHQVLLDRLNSPAKVFGRIFARRYQFNRRLGEGISVFNPGDKTEKTKLMTNLQLQNQLNQLLQDSNKVRYIYSRYAKTNNGIYGLMDIKAHNKDRFANLHGIISEGVHKVEDIEENVNSLFLALINPEDHENMTGTQSFSDRITYIKIPYVLDYNTEVKIYLNTFGDQIGKDFLPRVLQNFAKVIISSRLRPRSEGLMEWIDEQGRYISFCDENLQLLKMDIYTGRIPPWLSEEDRKNFTAKRRRRIIAESESDGNKGFSGRDSLTTFNEFYSTYAKADKPITMEMVYKFFQHCRNEAAKHIPDGFLDSLVRQYNYTVLQEVKESLYYYNEERISRDIQNYLFAVNFEVGTIEKCIYTEEELEITDAFFEGIEHRLLKADLGDGQRMTFRMEIQNEYASRTLTQEMLSDGKNICETEIYQSLHERYVHNLKEKVMEPFLNNDNFRNAIKDFATESFKTYDKRIREEVAFLIDNLKNKYGYTEQGAKEVCIYVVDNDLARTFTER